MANLKEIKRKIKSVQNTQKTTRAMKLVSTAKLKRAEMAAKQSRVYAVKINEVLSEIAYKINQYKNGAVESRFFDKNETPSTVDVIFVTADKGLCGGFNIQTIKAVRNLLAEYGSQKVTVRLRAVGRKGIAFFNFQGVELLTSYAGVSSSPSYEKAQEIIKSAIDDFVEGKTDKVILVHNGYKNMISQELKIVDVVPVQSPIESRETSSLMELEPDESGEEILDSLLQKYFEYNMYYALIDSLAAEHSSRMQAMEYMISLQGAKTGLAEWNVINNISGAFGAFRTQFIRRIGGWDTHSAEDLDITLRIKQYMARHPGLRIPFAAHAMGHTDAPTTAKVLFMQRIRWDGDLYFLYLRKHKHGLSPKLLGWKNYIFTVMYGVLQNILLPYLVIFYNIWLFLNFPAGVVLAGFAIQYFCYLFFTTLHFLVFFLAISERPKQDLYYFKWLPVYPLYSFVMRIVNAAAVLNEVIRRGHEESNMAPWWVLKKGKRF